MKWAIGTNLVRSDLYDIFEPRLVGITELIRQQLTTAKEAGHIVNKTAMTGGFSKSKCVRTVVEKVLKNMTPELGFPVALVNDVSDTVMYAVPASKPGILLS